jgi:hypothetical protein
MFIYLKPGSKQLRFNIQPNFEFYTNIEYTDQKNKKVIIIIIIIIITSAVSMIYLALKLIPRTSVHSSMSSP